MSPPVLLLVDDEPEMRLIVGALARREGHALDWCPDAPSAWDYLRKARPDLVLLDVNLPGTSGVELCRRLRQTPALAALPVALFTHGGVPQDVAAGLEAGADFLVCKDLVCRPADWRRRLAEILGRLGSNRPAGGVEWGSEVIRAAPLAGWADRLNETLRHPSLRQVAPEVLQVVLRKALRRTFGQEGSPAEPETWVAPGEGRLDPRRVPASPRPGVVAALLAALADGLECLLGEGESAPARRALADLARGWPGGCSSGDPS
jgi:CheY-like chemotaxis protein